MCQPDKHESRHEERMLNGDERDMIVAALRSVAQGPVPMLADIAHSWRGLKQLAAR
jgi:hypothetical protein